jgi:3-hydroxybutyryl-CoA dehydrogenase
MLKPENLKTIAIIGAGFMGPGIAQVFAVKGYRVNLEDIKPEVLPKAIDSVRANLEQLAAAGVLAATEIEPVLGRIRTTTDLHEAVDSAQLVIEAVSENMPLKQKIFQELDSICPLETILCSNTSVMSISEIASQSKNRRRIVGTHFWNPPFLIPLVEVVKGKDTSDETLNVTYDLLQKAGKRPVKCLQDVPGFIANRLQHALWREAVSIVEHGIADAATVDEAIKNSFGIRLPVLGPLENADMVGLDLILSIHDYVFKSLESSREPSPLLKEKVSRGELGFKSGNGFYRWTPEEARKLREKLSAYLIEHLKEEMKKEL